jgi:hypothetical protein
MTIALAIIGSIVILLGAATRIPPAAAAFLRAFIPLVAAFHDLHDALRNIPARDDQSRVDERPLRDSWPCPPRPLPGRDDADFEADLEKCRSSVLYWRYDSRVSG